MASQHGVEALVAAPLRSQAFKNGRGRLSGTKIMNEDIKVINRRWPSRRERPEEDSSSLLHTMPLFPATAAAHAVINDAASQNIYFSSSCAILEKLLLSYHAEPCVLVLSREGRRLRGAGTRTGNVLFFSPLAANSLGVCWSAVEYSAVATSVKHAPPPVFSHCSPLKYFSFLESASSPIGEASVFQKVSADAAFLS